MGTWNNDYNKTPRNGYNPGYGAQEFRLLKTNLSDRLSVEHIFGNDETTLETAVLTGGVHKEGSAKAYCEDARYTATQRTAKQVTDAFQVGQIFVGSEERSTTLQTNLIDGTSNDALYTHQIKTNVQHDPADTTLTKETIFDYDKFVNTDFDQIGSNGIDGIKEFLKAVRVPDITESDLVKTSAAGSFPTPASPASTKDSVPMGQIRTIVADAKEHNIFDPSDSYNTSHATDGILYTDEVIHCSKVYAEKGVFGAVWG